MFQTSVEKMKLLLLTFNMHLMKTSIKLHVQCYKKAPDFYANYVQSIQYRHQWRSFCSCYVCTSACIFLLKKRNAGLKGWNQPWEVFLRVSVLKNFAKLTRKHLCQTLFFNKECTGVFL